MIGTCEYCEDTEVELTQTKIGLMCGTCLSKDSSAKSAKVTNDEVSLPQIEPSTTPVNPRLIKAYLDKFNSIPLSGMTHEQVRQHIADQEDTIRILQAQLQATVDLDDEWSRALSKEQREALRAKDKEYRALARPATNSDGTLKTSKVRQAKPVVVGDPGTKAFDSLVEKLMRTGMSKEQATAMVQGMKGQK